jgi:phage head maturation protease
VTSVLYDADVAFWDRIRFAFRAASEDFTAPVHTIDGVIRAARASSASAPISRDIALQVPAVQRGRNLICAIATLPLVQYDPAGARVRSTLFDLIDPQVPNVVTMAQTVEDLLFDGIAWWRITDRGWNDFPSNAQRVDPDRVRLTPPLGAQPLSLLPSGADPNAAVWIDGKVVDGRDMIRFDSPNPPLLVAARRAIRRAAKIETAAERYADNPAAREYFTPAEGADPAEDDDIEQILADWEASRRERSTAYVPASLVYNTIQMPTPADLQLVQLQQRAALDIANAMGIDPEDLGINVTSRTYQNVTDRRIDRINDVLGPYMSAITGRLGMNDVTRRGYTVDFDLTRYLRADPLTAASVSVSLAGLNAITRDEIRDRNGLTPLTPAQRAELTPAPAPAKGAPVKAKNSAPISAEFSSEPRNVTLTFEPDETFAASAEKRTVTGTLVPFGPVGSNGSGRWRFQPGSIEWSKSAVSRVKLNREHDRLNLLGAATAIKESNTGVTASFKVARGVSGDDALSMAEDQVLDGLSAEVDILDFTSDPADPSVYLVTKARLTGAALTGTPAFDDARLTKVAASKNEGNPVMDPETEQAPAAPAAAPVAVALTADSVRDMIRDALGANADERPAVVNPAARPVAFVNEALPYRFDRGGNFTRADHEFSTDIVSMLKAGDTEGANTEAGKRVMGLLAQSFSTVATTDINELTPSLQRPDMYVDQRDYKTPLWDIVSKGAPPNGVQPFVVPKFSSSSGLVGDHTEGTEPTGGTFVTTSQTITPTALSGKASVTRETWDMGGNPAVSTLIFNQMRRGYFEGLETATGTFLNTLTAATDIDLGIAVIDEDLATAWDTALAGLQFVRTYDFSAFAVEQYLYKAFVNATDGQGRKLFPIIAPSNANGTAQSRFRTLNLSGVTGVPAWGLGAGTGGAANNSWLFDPAVVHGWATAPQRLELAGSGGGTSYQPVAFVDVAIWGYKAFANTDIAGVRQVIYDNA